MIDYADLGLYVLHSRHKARIGWTTPSLIYDEMRRVDASAKALDQDMLHVADGQVRQAWADWYHAWQTYFAQRMTTGSKIWAANPWSNDSDIIRDQTNAYATALADWYTTYAKQKAATGEPVPPPGAPGAPPPVPVPQPGSLDSQPWGLPWWSISLLTLGGVGAVIGLGWYLYMRAKAPSLLDQQAPRLLVSGTPSHVGCNHET